MIVGPANERQVAVECAREQTAAAGRQSGLARQVEEAAEFLRRRWSRQPQAGLILGTGLGALAGHLRTEVSLPFGEIPHFACSTALSHMGRLRLGWMSEAAVIVMEGRCHGYEGYPMDQITLPVRVMRALGAKTLLVTCASGGLNSLLTQGDVMIIDDHMNWSGFAPLSGAADPAAPRCLTGRVIYDRALAEAAERIARREGFAAPRGVYAAMSGPNYETRAEYRMLRRLGADVVGMSTLPEAAVGAWLGMEVLGLTVVTNVARPDAPRQVQAEDVVRAAEQSEPKIRKIVLGVLSRMAGG